MEKSVCFTGAQVLSGDDFDLIPNAALMVEGERIISIERAGEHPEGVDLSGKLVVPMFINAHCHLGDTGAKELGVGLQLEQLVNPPHGLKHRFLNSLQPDVHVAMMRHGLGEMLLNGVIACADFREQDFPGALSLRKAAEGLPIRVMILGRVSADGTSQEIEDAAKRMLEEAEGLGVRDVTCYEPAMLARLRHAYPDKIFAVHVAESRDAERESYQRTGISQTVRALEWGADLLVHLVHASEADLDRVARSETIAVSCPRSNGILGDGLPRLAAWKRAGIRFALGTDNLMLVAPDLLREMDYASRMTRGLEEDPTAIDHLSILKAATIMGARALRLDDQLGSLAPGKEASFIVFDLSRPNLQYIQDPISALVHRASRADIEAIYIRGKRFYP